MRHETLIRRTKSSGVTRTTASLLRLTPTATDTSTATGAPRRAGCVRGEGGVLILHRSDELQVTDDRAAVPLSHSHCHHCCTDCRSFPNSVRDLSLDRYHGTIRDNEQTKSV